MSKNNERTKKLIFYSFSFCILSISIIFFALSIGKPYIGTDLYLESQGWIVKYVYADSLASEVGINEGDKPVKINGQPAQEFLEQYGEPGVVFGMLIKELTVMDDIGHIKSVTLEGERISWDFLVGQIKWLVLCFVFWIIGFYVYLKRPASQPALLLCLSGLCLGLVLSANMASELSISTALHFEVVASTIGPWLILHFFLVLPEKRIKFSKNPLIYLIYLPAAITLILYPIFGYAKGQALPDFRSFRLFEYGAGFLAVMSVAIANYLSSASLITRQQMKIVLVGCITAMIPFLILSVLPEAIWGKPVISADLSILFIACIPLSLGYAVLTKKLMDIDIIIRRGIVYGLITIIMAGILSVAIFFTANKHASVGIPVQILVALALGGIATALFGPIKKWIEILIDKLFYKDRYDYRKLIEMLSASLRSLNDFAEVSRVIVGVTVQTLNLAGSCLFVKTQSGSLDVGAAQGTFTQRGKQDKLLALISQGNNKIEFPTSASSADPDLAFIIPLIAADKEVGILCLSPKVSRQNFSSVDMYLLQGIASTAAITLRSAMLIHDVSIRDTFVSIASHELRTPMTTIIGYANLLIRRDPPDATRRQWLEEIIDSGRSITSLLDELLNVTRIQAGEVDMKLERERIADVLEERLAMIRESTNKHEFVLNIEPELPDVMIDYDKFGQVVGNLLDNAVKYSPNGGRITVSAYNDLQRRQIVVSFTDEGIGIDPTDKNLLFTTFHRIKRPETYGIRGSGLGLYIVKEWIEAMGGEIWLESELNKGSTFFIAIPTKDPKNDELGISVSHSGAEYDQKDINSRRRRKNP